MARYSIDTVSKGCQIVAYVVRVFIHGNCIKTVNFPVTNPSAPARTLNRACEFGRLAVKNVKENS